MNKNIVFIHQMISSYDSVDYKLIGALTIKHPKGQKGCLNFLYLLFSAF